jgi:hypothetical protein
VIILSLSPSSHQSPTLGAHTHAHALAHTHAHAHAHPCPLVLGGHGCDIIVHAWAWVGIGFVHPCIQLQIGVKLLGCRNTLTKKRFEPKPTTVNNLLFVRSNQDLV